MMDVFIDGDGVMGCDGGLDRFMNLDGVIDL